MRDIKALRMIPAYVKAEVNTLALAPREVAKAWRKAGRPSACYFAGSPGAKGSTEAFPSPTGLLRDAEGLSW